MLIQGDENASFSRKTQINWGTFTVETMIQVPLGKRNILVLVLVGGKNQKVGDIYNVTVGDCVGELPVKLF